MNTIEIIGYYADLLIFQYQGLPRASETIKASVNPIVMPQTSTQNIIFSVEPVSGDFVLSWAGNDTATINWDDDAATIQTKLQAVTGLSSVLVSGSISSLTLTVTFDGVTPPADLLVVESNTLMGSIVSVGISIVETDLTLPLAVQNAFNLKEGSEIAVGKQLDWIAEYVGVSRTGFGFSTQITLDDDDFVSLIRMGIIKNSSGSSLATIQDFIYQFFAGQMLVFDYQNMSMSYLISSEVGSLDLIEMFVTQGLLPKPMGVRVTAIIYVPTAKCFGFRTYKADNPNARPFNSYKDYHTDWPWLSYHNGLPI